MMIGEIDKTMQRTRQYFYSDGLVEIATGGLYLLIALYLYLQAVVSEPTVFYAILAAGFPVVIIGGSIVVKRLIKALKERIIYPRTGYAAFPHKETQPRRLLTFAIAFVAAIGIVLARTWIGSIVLAGGLLLGLAYGIVGLRLGLIRHYALAVVCALTGIGLMAAHLDTMWVLFGVVGSTSLVIGLAALARYLRQNPPPAEESL